MRTTSPRSLTVAALMVFAFLVVDIQGQRREHAPACAWIRRVPSLDGAPQNPVQTLGRRRIRDRPLHPGGIPRSSARRTLQRRRRRIDLKQILLWAYSSVRRKIGLVAEAVPHI